MAECIEREATIKRIKEVYCVGCNSYNGVRCRACGTGDAIGIIEDAPAADVAPVVRCKDCKHAYINSFAVSSGEALCTLSGKPMQQDDFCSYGEPKEGTHADDHD